MGAISHELFMLMRHNFVIYTEIVSVLEGGDADESRMKP